MRKNWFLASGLLATVTISGQISKEYFELCRKADSLYRAGDYKNSANTYSSAFKANGWKGTYYDRYNAACSAALAKIPDSAIFYLQRAVLGGYKDYSHISTDSDLNILHDDKRWQKILDDVKANKEKAEVNLNKPLAQMLDSIMIADQQGRLKMNALEKKYGWDSKEMKELWVEIGKNDSLNLIKVSAVLDKYGWLGPDVVGSNGSSALFLVIQHSDIKTQQKYLPMMREAVNKGKASPSSLALLEDRVALREGKKQIYGSQIGRNEKSGEYYVLPLGDPDNVDKRRAEAGLQPLADYIGMWNIKWNVEQYKKDLPNIEAYEKNRAAARTKK
jgi:hypothetical protein